MKLTQLAQKARRAIDDRGGTERLKRDVEDLREIALGDGAPKEKAKRAAEALKRPPEPGGTPEPHGASEGQGSGSASASESGDASRP
jgi:hypothetical protein